MINKSFKEMEKKKKFNEVVEELKKKSQKNKSIMNGPLQGRLSKVKTYINSNMNNINSNGTNNIKNINLNSAKNENGNVSYITTSTVINNNPNKNEVKTNNNNNNISDLAIPSANNKSNINVKENTSILPLN